MVRSMKTVAFAASIVALSAFPALAQDLALPGLGLDLDPLHILTPAPPPPAPPPPAAAPVAHHHHLHQHWHHHHVLHHAAEH